MPAVVLLLIWWKRGKVTTRDLAALAPFFVVGLGMAAVTTWMERTQVGARGPEWEAITVPQRILIAGRAIWFYVQKNLLPLDLSFIYPRWNLAAAPATWWLYPAGVVVVAGVLFALRRTIGRGPVAAWLIFCGVLVPALGFIDFYPMRYAFVADHFQYLAAPALIALIVAAGAVLLRRVAASAPAAPYVVAGLLLVVAAALSIMQARVYAGPMLLWADAIENNTTSPMLRYNYGLDLLAVIDRGDLPPEDQVGAAKLASEQFAEAVKLDPRHDRAWARWGGALNFLGQQAEALEKFDEALRLRPDNVDAMGGRGRALFELKRYDEARAAFAAALAAAQQQRGTGAIARSSVAAIYQYLGRIAAAQNDLDAAARQYAESVAIVNDNPQTRYEYGVILARQAGATVATEAATTQQAATQATQATTQQAATQVAVATKPAAATTTQASTQASTQPSEENKKRLGAAAQQLAAAISIRPDFVDARVALAHLMMDVGNIPGANTQLAAALRAAGSNISPELKAAVERWDLEFRKREAATRPATGPATGPATTTTAATTVPTTR
jgi:tetratricopeptide (TPR) repeat protein